MDVTPCRGSSSRSLRRSHCSPTIHIPKQSREYIRRFFRTASHSLPSMMKRELVHRLLLTFALLLALWASLANSVYDALGATITAGCLLMLAGAVLTALYFFGPINDRLPARYRIVAVLAPQNCALEGELKETFASTMGILKHPSTALYTRSGSGAGGGKRHLARLNARKLEAIRAAGLSTAQLERPHIYGARRRSESDSMAGGGPSASQRPSLAGPERSSLDSSVVMDSSLSNDVSAVAGQAPDKSWLGQLVLVPWTALVRHRRLLDAVMAVLLVGFAVMCADEGRGNANYARLVVLVVAALLTGSLCALPHVKVRLKATRTTLTPFRTLSILLSSLISSPHPHTSDRHRTTPRPVSPLSTWRSASPRSPPSTSS